MSQRELAKYKYHIDLGGGGGTTWTGTLQKVRSHCSGIYLLDPNYLTHSRPTFQLAMPGLLFHHVTSTKDYLHDYMKAWVHYVPVREDLRDLERRLQWAKDNPQKARKIAQQGSDLARWFGSNEGFEQLYQRDFFVPLTSIIEAYQPISSTSVEYTWSDVLSHRLLAEDSAFYQVVKCSGNVSNGGCVQLK
jgi:hypothetical protein